jgi:hypothetical protein
MVSKRRLGVCSILNTDARRVLRRWQAVRRWSERASRLNNWLYGSDEVGKVEQEERSKPR